MNTALYKYFINVLVAVVVGVINYLIRVIFTMLSGFERYKTITKQNNAMMKKQFVSLFINIGILIVLINANLQDR
jgi:small-conductance mechanosensitive channel